MTDFAAPRSSGRLCLTDRVAREVVLMHVALLCDIGIKSLYLLRLGKRSESHNVADLCLSAGEHRGAVYTGDDIHLGCQRTDLADLASVRSLMLLQNHAADSLLLILVDSIGQKGKPLFVVCEFLFQSVCDGGDVVLSGLLVVGEHGNFHLGIRNFLADRGKKLLRNRAALVGVFRFSALCHDMIKESNNLFICLIGKINGLDHFLLRNFLRAGLDHDDLLSCGGNGQCKR